MLGSCYILIPNSSYRYMLTSHICHSFPVSFLYYDPSTTELYTLSLHDALPISPAVRARDLGGIGQERREPGDLAVLGSEHGKVDRKSTRLNSSHVEISYAVFCLKKKTPSTCFIPQSPFQDHLISPLRTLVIDII